MSKLDSKEPDRPLMRSNPKLILSDDQKNHPDDDDSGVMSSRASSIDALLKILAAAAIISPNLAGDVLVLLGQVTNTDAWPGNFWISSICQSRSGGAGHSGAFLSRKGVPLAPVRCASKIHSLDGDGWNAARHHSG